MIKYIKVINERIMEVRPLLPEGTDPEIVSAFELEFIKADVPENINDMELLTKYIYTDGNFIRSDYLLDLKNLINEKLDIFSWLTANDWIPNKIITGEWTTADVRWTTYLQERATKRARLDEIEVELASL